MNYWINSNSGDYIEEQDGFYKLCLISRWQKLEDGRFHFLPYEIVEINRSQFDSLKGFVPIKEKKLLSRLKKPQTLIYAPTVSLGVKGVSKRINPPDISEARKNRLKILGL